MTLRLQNEFVVQSVLPPIRSALIHVRLLKNFDKTIVGIDLQTYYLGKQGDKVELPYPNAMQLISQNAVALCSN